MNGKALEELGSLLKEMVEANAANNDMLTLLCAYFADAIPEQAGLMRSSLERLRAASDLEITPSFLALAERVEQALSPNGNFQFLSMKRLGAAPEYLTELLSRLRSVQDRD